MRERAAPTVETVALVGGRLCLDFANTANWLDGAPVDERLTAFADLAAWGRRLGLIDGAAEAALKAGAAADPAASAVALGRAVRLRASLRRLFALAGSAADIDGLNAALAGPAPMLAADGRRPVLVPPPGDLGAWLLRPVAASAAELLTSAARGRVKGCPGDRCGWLFLDESPSGRRRWCSMATCGNRRKARAHYSRRRSRDA